MTPRPPADSAELISAADLERRIVELAAAIAPSFDDEPPVVVAVLEGARTFAEQLCALLPGRPRPFSIRASSYGAGTVSTGKVSIDGGEEIPVRAQRLLLVEDIVDTGRTLLALREHFTALGAADIATVTLLSKPARRVVSVPLDHVGFEIADRFVVGFGMDLDGQYRDLPMIRTLPGTQVSSVRE